MSLLQKNVAPLKLGRLVAGLCCAVLNDCGVVRLAECPDGVLQKPNLIPSPQRKKRAQEQDSGRTESEYPVDMAHDKLWPGKIKLRRGVYGEDKWENYLPLPPLARRGNRKSQEDHNGTQVMTASIPPDAICKAIFPL